MKKSLINRIMTLACPIVNLLIGVALLAIPELAMEWVCPVLAVSMLLVGIVQVISYLMTSPGKNADNNGFGIGVLLLVLAVTILMRQEQVLQMIPFVLGLMIALNGIRELQNGVDVTRLHIPRAWIVVLVALVNLILGVVLMFNPFAATVAALNTALGIGLIVSGCADLVTTLVIYAKSRESTSPGEVVSNQDM